MHESVIISGIGPNMKASITSQTKEHPIKNKWAINVRQLTIPKSVKQGESTKVLTKYPFIARRKQLREPCQRTLYQLFNFQKSIISVNKWWTIMSLSFYNRYIKNIMRNIIFMHFFHQSKCRQVFPHCFLSYARMIYMQILQKVIGLCPSYSLFFSEVLFYISDLHCSFFPFSNSQVKLLQQKIKHFQLCIEFQARVI